MNNFKKIILYLLIFYSFQTTPSTTSFSAISTPLESGQWVEVSVASTEPLSSDPFDTTSLRSQAAAQPAQSTITPHDTTQPTLTHDQLALLRSELPDVINLLAHHNPDAKESNDRPVTPPIHSVVSSSCPTPRSAARPDQDLHIARILAMLQNLLTATQSSVQTRKAPYISIATQTDESVIALPAMSTALVITPPTALIKPQKTRDELGKKLVEVIRRFPYGHGLDKTNAFKAQLKELLQEGADPNYFSKENNGSALYWVCNGSGQYTIDLELMDLLLNAGANPNGVTTQDYQTPLYTLLKGCWNVHGSTVRQNLEAIRKLIKHGADVNLHGIKDYRESPHKADRDSALPITLPLYDYNSELFFTLLDAGANVHGVKYCNGCTIRRYIEVYGIEAVRSGTVYYKSPNIEPIHKKLLELNAE